MTRTKEREQAFIMLFEKAFNNDVDIDELFSYAYETESFEKSEFCEALVKTALENLETIDGIIEKYSIGWKLNRLPKVSLSVLRLALCEIIYVDSIPDSVSVNEAVELTKTYAGIQDSSFVNGILGTYLRENKKDE
ncbi:MAG: transcription antitermination factor NusB [Clostridia bacterium]|nr:transcription antitermination factor NusB [Clostridia bacterium]